MKISSQTTATTTSSQAGGSPWIHRPDAGPLGQLLFGKRPPKLPRWMATMLGTA